MLYAIVDPDHAPGGNVIALATRCLAGGASYVQLRAKRLGDAELLRLAREVGGLCRGRARFFVNDRADLAALAGAHGVHVGQEDLLPARARRALLPGQWLGISTHNERQVEEALNAGAEILGFGPVFPSGTKVGHAAVTGVDGLRRAVVLAGPVPVVAIGGITEDNAGLCAAAGAHAVAVIGALAMAAEPEKKAQAIRAAFLASRPVATFPHLAHKGFP